MRVGLGAISLSASLLTRPLAGQTPSGSAAPPVAPAADTTDRSADRVETTGGTTLLAAPDGAEIATVRGATSARIVGRADGWTRIQVEGWVRNAAVRPATSTTLTGVTAAEVRAKPERYVGQTVDWRLQLIAVQAADELRPEMAPGQPYLLTRGPLPERGFVYVTVSNAEAERLRALPALEELTLRVTIRAPRTRYLETPVVELVAVVAGGNGASR